MNKISNIYTTDNILHNLRRDERNALRELSTNTDLVWLSIE